MSKIVSDYLVSIVMLIRVKLCADAYFPKFDTFYLVTPLTFKYFFCNRHLYICSLNDCFLLDNSDLVLNPNLLSRGIPVSEGNTTIECLYLGQEGLEVSWTNITAIPQIYMVLVSMELN